MEDAQDFVMYQQSLQDAYRLVFDRADEPIKRKAVAQLVRVLRGSDQKTVYAVEEAFFLGSDLQYLSDADRRLTKTHLLARLKTDRGTRFLNALSGIGPYLSEEAEIQQFVYPLARLAAANYEPARIRLVQEASALDLLGMPAHDTYKKALEAVLRTYKNRGASHKSETERLSAVIEYFDVPF